MSLATRCSECGTVFRVVPDQLKVSDGWVRCGRCSAVFNAQASLFDLDEAASAARFDNTASPPDARAGLEASNPSDHPSTLGRFDLDLGATIEPTPVGSGSGESGHGLDDEPGISRLEPSAELAADSSALLTLPGLDDSIRLVEPSLDDGSPASVVAISGEAVTSTERALQIDPDEVAATPSFMQTDHRSPVWNQPGVRRGLPWLAVLLALCLVLQGVLLWRDSLAAQFTALRPALISACEALGCRIQPVRRIDRLSVDASGLTHIDGAPLHRLSLSLRNRAEMAVACPSIELSLTDPQGQLLARRVMQVADFGVAATTIAAGAELPLQALLSTGDRRISGYTVELFYP